jgi:hypothetical protein
MAEKSRNVSVRRLKRNFELVRLEHLKFNHIHPLDNLINLLFAIYGLLLHFDFGEVLSLLPELMLFDAIKTRFVLH